MLLAIKRSRAVITSLKSGHIVASYELGYRTLEAHEFQLLCDLVLKSGNYLAIVELDAEIRTFDELLQEVQEL